MGKSQRDKGKRGELDLARELRRIGFSDARRGVQYNGLDGHDVVGIPGIHIECKRTERLSACKALSQAQVDSDAGDVPIVAWRRSRMPWVVFCELDLIVPFAVRVLRELGYTVDHPRGARGFQHEAAP